AASGPCLSPASWAALLRVGVPPLQIGQTGRQWFWVLLPKQKDLVVRGRNPGIEQNLKSLTVWFIDQLTTRRRDEEEVSND
ncbi:MAG: hypothetical protein WBO24_10190, partial [Nitrospirales bacterium]